MTAIRFFYSPFKRVYLVDDPFVLDDISMPGKSRMIFGLDMAETDTLLNPNRVVSHNFRLRKYLKSRQGLSVFEQTVLNDALRNFAVSFRIKDSSQQVFT